MSEMEREDYARALAAIKALIDAGLGPVNAADHVTVQFSHLIGNDEAASESLYEEADEYAAERARQLDAAERATGVQ